MLLHLNCRPLSCTTSGHSTLFRHDGSFSFHCTIAITTIHNVSHNLVTATSSSPLYVLHHRHRNRLAIADELPTPPPLASSSLRNPTSPSLANEKLGAAHIESFDGTVTVARDYGPLSGRFQLSRLLPAIPIPPTPPAHVYPSMFIPPPSPPPLLLLSIGSCCVPATTSCLSPAPQRRYPSRSRNPPTSRPMHCQQSSHIPTTTIPPSPPLRILTATSCLKTQERRERRERREHLDKGPPSPISPVKFIATAAFPRKRGQMGTG
ncbi:hypothetical protein BD779DRAFT_1671553 [Infundibulicybe gibba]|nr:hypothetical protein BD779DRAFT_1671553 [Infundibulicybe gibba]